jgi:hypothetical protein
MKRANPPRRRTRRRARPCVVYANAGADFYSGSGAEVITDTHVAPRAEI